eukprot:GHVP01008885.1.p1 GENE.GHVP01008885.1~~GHVP01008885.1.p1  ORF type:complete len:160 (-),score=34.76 GHVP01008885.1:158-637(-)
MEFTKSTELLVLGTNVMMFDFYDLRSTPTFFDVIGKWPLDGTPKNFAESAKQFVLNDQDSMTDEELISHEEVAMVFSHEEVAMVFSPEEIAMVQQVIQEDVMRTQQESIDMTPETDKEVDALVATFNKSPLKPLWKEEAQQILETLNSNSEDDDRMDEN